MSSYTRRVMLNLLRELDVPRPASVREGRPRALTPAQEAAALQRLAQGERQGTVAKDLGVHRHTLSRLRRRAQADMFHV